MGTAVFYAAQRWMPRAPGIRPVGPREIRVASDMQPSDVVPVSPGELADCNLLLVTLDTTRADRIGCYGHEKIKTHALDRLASEGVLFSPAIAPAPITLPSHASMMTGLYPYHHGVRANGLYQRDEKFETLAEMLSAAGYATGAMLSASVLDSQFGLAQGFRDYDDEIDARDQEQSHAHHDAERRGDKTAERADDWLRTHAEDKFFLWVHLFDPHFPYEAPAPYSNKQHPYNAEIIFADVQLGRLIQRVEELGLTGKTLVVVAGDHGEGLGQHGEGTHGCLVYESTLHVPLIMRCGQRLGGLHVDRLVSLVDVMPTVLTMLGVETPAGLDGVDLTRPPSGERVVVFETLQGFADHGWAALLGLRKKATKYIYGPTDELFDLTVDPFEETDLCISEPELASKMKKELERFFGEDLQKASTSEPTHELDSEQLDRLQSLGYLSGAGDGSTPAEERPHPKDMLPLLGQVQRALDLERTKGPNAVIKQLERIVRDHPDLYTARLDLGKFYAKKDDLQRAEIEWAHYMEIQPDRAPPALLMARLRIRQNRFDEAISFFQEAISRNPRDMQVLKRYGSLLTERGEYGDALELLITALELQPSDTALPNAVAELAIALGRKEKVIAIFQRLLEANPELSMVRDALSRLLNDKPRDN